MYVNWLFYVQLYHKNNGFETSGIKLLCPIFNPLNANPKKWSNTLK